MQYRRGVVALGVVAGKERRRDKRDTKQTDINRAHKNPQHKIALWKSIQHIYETPEILRSMIPSTVSCLQSDNDVSTSNSPPARNIVMIYLDYLLKRAFPNTKILQSFSLLKSRKQKCCICKTLKSIPYFCKHTHDH